MKSNYATLIQDARQALVARDAIEDCGSAKWRAAHRKAKELFVQAEAQRPANPDTISRRHADPVRVTWRDLH